MDCVLHGRALLSGFKDEPLQLSISWDPGSYNGKQIAAAVCYFPSCDRAAYLLSQRMAKLMLSDTDDSLIEKAKQKIDQDRGVQ